MVHLVCSAGFLALVCTYLVLLMKSASSKSISLLTTKNAKSEGGKFTLKQVPGDGGCLFHSIASVLRFEHTGYSSPFNPMTQDYSISLRRIAINTLSESDFELEVEGDERMSAKRLLEVVAGHYNTTIKSYCDRMRERSAWGGGPEIVALSNLFSRPIHIYELTNTEGIFRRFLLSLQARFGSPAFDISPPMRILCVDGRFPNLSPGSQNKVGNHFMALFKE